MPRHDGHDNSGDTECLDGRSISMILHPGSVIQAPLNPQTRYALRTYGSMTDGGGRF